uniref:Transmembrane 9 superfamily member n=1 Tax=Echeneis naucrates TaxID=173247 RepID=A0A665UE40_ECHNA
AQGPGLELGEQADNLTLYVNTVGPYHNPQETYHYYTLPVCRPEKVHHKSLSLGEVLEGDRMAESLYHIRFRENVEKKTLSEKQVDQLREAIEELYYFEFVLDDIPVWGFVGYIEESGFLRHRLVEYNGNSMIFANVSVKDVKPVPLGEGVGAAVDYSFFPKTLEIINSLVLVVLLFVILMRVPKNDFSRSVSRAILNLEFIMDIHQLGHWFISSFLFKYTPTIPLQALPATTVLLLLGAWMLVGFPLTVIGGMVGKNRAGSFQAPCRTRNIPRQIPTQPWYKHTAVHMDIGGFLPFR